MRSSVITTCAIGLLALTGCAASGPRKAIAGCATCVFHMNNVTGCKLAVKIDGTPYLVRGSDIDDHGDAHAADGLCNASRRALIEGKATDGVFVARKIELLKGTGGD